MINTLKFYCITYKKKMEESKLYMNYHFFLYDTNKESAINRFVGNTKYNKKDIVSIEEML